MRKKHNFTEKIEKLIAFIERVMQSKLVIAVLLLVDGIALITNPHGGVTGLGQGLAISVGLAALTILITTIPKKPKSRNMIIKICLAAAALIMCVAFYFWPTFLSEILIHLLAIVVMSNSVSNILHILKLRGIKKKKEKVDEKAAELKRELYENSPDYELSASIEQGVESQFSRFLNPLKRITENLGIGSIISIIIDLLSIAAGILIFFHESVGDVIMRVCGLAMVIVAISDLRVIIRAWIAKRKEAQAEQEKQAEADDEQNGTKQEEQAGADEKPNGTEQESTVS